MHTISEIKENMKYQPESLSKVLETIKTAASKLGISISKAQLSKESLTPHVQWKASCLEDILEFLSYSASSDHKKIFLNSSNITFKDLQALLEEVDAEEISVEASFLESLKKQDKNFEEIGMMQLFFISRSEGAIHSISIQSKLNSLIFSDFDDDQDESYEDEFSISDSDIDAAASRLANFEKFQSSKGWSQKNLIATRFFKDELDENDDFPIDEVIDRASTIFEVDIKPSLDIELSKKAQEMLDGGMLKKDIALKLKISPAKLRSLI